MNERRSSMSWVLLASLVVLMAAILLIEYRAIRIGDERRSRAPGYSTVLIGLALIGAGVAGAATGWYGAALLTSAFGLALVTVGALQHREATFH
jgi:hypothetical protein